jgi:hypothetical protein
MPLSGCVVLGLSMPGAVVTWFVTGFGVGLEHAQQGRRRRRCPVPVHIPQLAAAIRLALAGDLAVDRLAALADPVRVKSNETQGSAVS